MADEKAPQGLDGLPPRLKRAETVLRLRSDRIALVLEHSTDYQNIAAVVRTAESFGVQNVYVVQSATMRKDHALSDQRDEEGIRGVLRAAGATGSSLGPAASAGATEGPDSIIEAKTKSGSKAANSWVTLRPFASIAECVKALREDGREIWATDLTPGAELLATPREADVLGSVGVYCSGSAGGEAQAAKASASSSAASGGDGAAGLSLAGITSIPRRLAIVMGRETDGISPAFRAAADRRVFLPMYGFAESFNLSVAAALTIQRLFEICPEAHGDMAAGEKRRLRRAWFAKLLLPTPMRGQEDKFAAVAEASEGDAATMLQDLRRDDKRPMWNKKLRKRLESLDTTMGRFDVDAAVAASKRGRDDHAPAEAADGAKRAKPE